MLELNYYVTQRQDAELINSQNFMIERQHPVWTNVGESLATVDDRRSNRGRCAQAKLRGSNGQRLLVWQWNLINQQPIVNDHLAKLVLAFDRVRLKRDDGLSVLIATPYEETDIETAAATLARFAADMEPAIGRSARPGRRAVTAHIVHIVHRFDTGGMENGMVNLFNTLSPQRFRHTVVALTDYSDFRQRITAQPVAFHALHRPPGHGLGWTVRLWKLLRQLKPDLVHTRNLAALEAQFVAAAAGIRATVHGEHGRDVFDLYGQNWKYNLLRRAARPLVSNYIAVSRDLETWLRLAIRVPPRKLHQIYNGVDSEKFHPREGARPDVLPPGFADAESIVFGSVGRMVEVKDYPTLMRAFIQLVQQQPERPRTRGWSSSARARRAQPV